RLCARLREEAIRQPLGQWPAAVIFELVNNRFDGIIVDAQAADALVRIKSFPKTARAWRVGLGDGHGAMNASGGDGKLMQFGIAIGAERACAIAERITMSTCGGIGQIGHPTQHSLQSRHDRKVYWRRSQKSEVRIQKEAPSPRACRHGGSSTPLRTGARGRSGEGHRMSRFAAWHV